MRTDLLATRDEISGFSRPSADCGALAFNATHMGRLTILIIL